MRHGIDVDGTFRHLRKLGGIAESDLQYKAALETRIAASTWHSEGVHQAYPDTSLICLRCNRDVDSALHRFRTCPCNAHSKHENISSTKKAVKKGGS